MENVYRTFNLLSCSNLVALLLLGYPERWASGDSCWVIAVGCGVVGVTVLDAWSFRLVISRCLKSSKLTFLSRLGGLVWKGRHPGGWSTANAERII